MRPQLGTGPDPFAIRDNILAGTAYLRELHDRYGIVGMAGAYNAGPRRWEQHLAGNRRLPRETVGYIAKLAPTRRVDKVDGITSAVSLDTYLSSQSPLFFALASAQTAARPVKEKQRILAIIDVNTTIVPQFSGLFARGPNAHEPSPSDRQFDRSSSISATASDDKKAKVTISARPLSSLFAPTGTDRGAP